MFRLSHNFGCFGGTSPLDEFSKSTDSCSTESFSRIARLGRLAKIKYGFRPISKLIFFGSNIINDSSNQIRISYF